MRQIVVSRCRTDCNGSEVEPVEISLATLWGFNTMERQFINRFISKGDEVMLAEVILRLLTFDGVVFIPNYSKLSWIALSPFL